MAAIARQRFAARLPEQTERFIALLDARRAEYRALDTCDPDRNFDDLIGAAEQLDQAVIAPWIALGDEINYLEPAALASPATLRAGLSNPPAGLFQDLAGLSGEALREAALAITDQYTGLSFARFLHAMRAEITAPPFKQPAMLRWTGRLQEHLAALPKVGKAGSVVNALKKAAYELQYIDPAGVPDELRAEVARKNAANDQVPKSAAACGQVFIQLEGMKNKDNLFHLVTRDYRRANIWLQLTSGDNIDMASVVKATEAFITANPPPVPMRVRWAGLNYLNVVWQDKMVAGMLSALGGSFLVVLLMMTLLFRSPLYGLLAMVPLSVTITLIYGLVGWIGKDYDMPIAVLSSLTLGLSVDFAIHFLQRARELQKRLGDWSRVIQEMFKEPALAISRNAIIISLGFLPLLLAPLVPYRTVGIFLATIMAVSWLATLFILAALVTALQKWLFKTNGTPSRVAPSRV